jgi:hypothetical protein
MIEALIAGERDRSGEAVLAHLVTIPVAEQRIAQVIVAEAGGDMSVCQQHPPRRPGRTGTGRQ